jgi:hypothetical protein
MRSYFLSITSTLVNSSLFHGLAEALSFSVTLRRGNGQGARNAHIAESLEKQEVETSEWKEACYPVTGCLLMLDHLKSCSPNTSAW